MVVRALIEERLSLLGTRGAEMLRRTSSRRSHLVQREPRWDRRRFWRHDIR